MNQLSYAAEENAILPGREDTNTSQLQSFSRGEGHRDLLPKISDGDQKIPKSDSRPPERSTSSAELSGMHENRSTWENRNLSMNRAPSQSMSYVPTQRISSRSMKGTKQTPVQWVLPPTSNVNTFSQYVYPSRFPIQLSEGKHFGKHLSAQQSARTSLQDRASTKPILPSPLISGGIMVQSGIRQTLHEGATLPVSIAMSPPQKNVVNLVCPMTQVGGSKNTHMIPSLFTNQNSPVGVLHSPVMTPILSYTNTPRYTESPRNMNTSLLLCTPQSCNTPMQINSFQPPVAASMEMPPMLNLYNQNPTVVSYPSQASCNIQLAQVRTVPNIISSGKLQDKKADVHLTTMQTKNINTNPILSPQSKSKGQSIEAKRSRNGSDDKDIWDGSCEFMECKEGGSNLFITWTGQKKHLLAKLRSQNLEVRHCFITRNAKIFNVIFEDHTQARKAFMLQREVRIRMVPPKNSTRNWFRSPSPNFLVKYETKFRLTLRSGKAPTHDIVGDFLMSNHKEKKGCFIWANQLKGHRIRVVGCDGNFKLPNEEVVYRQIHPRMGLKNVTMGWVSYRNKHSKEDFVIRRSGNTLSEYIY